MRSKLWCCLLIFTLLSLGTISNTQPVNAQQAKVPSFDANKCQFDAPKGVKVVCGMLTVLEQHDEPDGPTIKLAVAIFKASSAKPKADPILYLDGGPGGHTLELATYRYAAAFKG